jgi:hypothetical protein
MAEELKSISEVIERFVKLAGLIALVYVVAMGLDYKAGSNWGRVTGDHAREQQGKPVLKELPDDDKPTLFWNDDKLIQGGLNGLWAVAILSIFVVFMLLFRRPTPEELPRAVAVLLGYPNSMAAFWTVAVVLGFWHDAGVLQWSIAALSLAAAVATWFLLDHLKRQIAILVLQSLCTGYMSGVASGFESVDFEKRFPLVEVVTTDAQVIDGLRMIKTGDTECRFVQSDGMEYLIPKAEIRTVRTVSAPAPAKPSPPVPSKK